MYFIGVDNGPSRTRTVVLNLESAALVAESEQAYGLVEGLPAGHCEQDPSLWIRAVDHTVRDCLQQLGDARGRVAGMGVSGQSRGLVVLDAENRIVRPAKLGADRSADGQAEEISRAFGGAPGLIELTGNPIQPSSAAPKLYWLKQHEPYHFQRIASVLSPHDFINYWLSGTKRSEFGEASETGLLDVRARAWRHELVEFIDPGLAEMLPPVRSSREPLGALRPELARGWGIGEDVLLSAGGSEDMMTALGCGAAFAGAVAISIDHTATICGVSAEPLIDPRGEVTAYCDATDRWMVLAQNTAAVACAAQVQRHFDWNDRQLDAALAEANPGADGLLFLPGLNGTSGHGPGAQRKGMLLGIDTANLTPGNMARSSMEALALEFGSGLRRMCELGFSPADLRLSGPGAASPAWRQLISDVLGLPVMSVRQDSCPALGAALQAAVTFFHQSGEDLTYAEMTSYAVEPEVRSLCNPDPGRHDFYRGLLERQKTLTEAFREDVFC